jgi:hypothetical protein
MGWGDLLKNGGSRLVKLSEGIGVMSIRAMILITFKECIPF